MILDESCQRPGFWIIDGYEVMRTLSKKTEWELYLNDEFVASTTSLDAAREFIRNMRKDKE